MNAAVVCADLNAFLSSCMLWFRTSALSAFRTHQLEIKGLCVFLFVTMLGVSAA